VARDLLADSGSIFVQIGDETVHRVRAVIDEVFGDGKALSTIIVMGARYPYYLLADSLEGQLKEAEITRSAPSSQSTRGDIRQGFVYERVPHITLKSIANNAVIGVIWEQWQAKLEPLREALNGALLSSRKKMLPLNRLV
jgi:hypothetical protein